MVPIPAPLAGLTVLAPRPPPELAAQCTSHTRRFWLIRQTEQIRASARPGSRWAQNLEPASPLGFDASEEAQEGRGEGGEEESILRRPQRASSEEVVRDADRGV